MAKANVTLASGAVVCIEGDPAEVERLLKFCSNLQSDAPEQGRQHAEQPQRSSAKATSRAASQMVQSGQPDLIEIVNLIKTCKQCEQIEAKILDKPSMTNRVLLPLFVIHEYEENSIGLTSGEISKITTQLGVPVSQPNASRCLTQAKSHVIGDSIRIKGQPVRYKLSRRGVQLLNEILKEEKAS